MDKELKISPDGMSYESNPNENQGLGLSEEQARMKKEAENMQIILDCPLCDAHGLHVIGKNQYETRQCLNCGYASSTKYVGTRETNTEYQKLPTEMQLWSEEADGRIWIPAIITLPFGMLYPLGKKSDGTKVIDILPETTHQNEIHWAFASMEPIPEDKIKDYEIPNQPGQYYEQMYDTERPEYFDTFLEGFAFLNIRAKEESEKLKSQMPGTEWPQEKVEDIKLPKLKKQ